MQSGEVLFAGMFDIENNVMVLYYMYFGDVCIKVVGQIELERVQKRNGSSYETVLVHKNPLDFFFFQNIRVLCEKFLGASAKL
jgi:hypothetical protein